MKGRKKIEMGFSFAIRILLQMKVSSGKISKISIKIEDVFRKSVNQFVSKLCGKFCSKIIKMSCSCVTRGANFKSKVIIEVFNPRAFSARFVLFISPVLKQGVSRSFFAKISFLESRPKWNCSLFERLISSLKLYSFYQWSKLKQGFTCMNISTS